MTSGRQSDGFDGETTALCRYLLLSEQPSGELVVRRPACDEEVRVDDVPTRWIVVTRPSEPPASAGSEP